MFERIKRIILPTPLQLWGSLVFALALVIGVYQGVVVPRLYQKVLVGPNDINQAGTGVLQQLNQFSIVRTAVEVGFWALVGIGCYIVYLALTNVIIDARNEVVIDTEYANRGTLAKHMRQYGYQVLSAVVLSALLLALAWWLLPLWLGLMDAVFFSGVTFVHVASAIGGFIGLAVTIYIVWMMTELTFAVDQL